MGFLRQKIKQMLPLWQRLGFNIIPNHFYQPIPDLRSLPDSLWESQSVMIGLSMNEESQIELLHSFSENDRCEYETFPYEQPAQNKRYYVTNPRDGSVDGEILYSMIRHFKTSRIIEIESGYSTLLSAQALEMKKETEGISGDLIAYEPYPAEWLSRGFSRLSQMVEKKVEEIPVEEFQSLGRNDILFIDSSHALRIGGDV